MVLVVVGRHKGMLVKSSQTRMGGEEVGCWSKVGELGNKWQLGSG